MAVFVNQQHIINSARVIVEHMRNPHDGPAYEADAAFQLGIDNLNNILSIGEANESTKREVCSMIDEMEQYKNLGTYVNGHFRPISSSVAARFDIAPGRFVSAKRFLVITVDQAKGNFEMFDLPDGAEWDVETDSIISKRYYYVRHPEEIRFLHHNMVAELNLEEVLLDYQLHQQEC